MAIKEDFFDIIIYSIYKSIFEMVGKQAWEIVWRSGEIALKQIEEKMGVIESDLFKSLQNLARYLEDMGYVSSIEFKKLSQKRFQYIMSNPVILKAATSLISEKMIPPHISTSLMFALLRRFNKQAKMVREPEFLEDGRVVETWEIESY